jgi:hypothetical protein
VRPNGGEGARTRRRQWAGRDGADEAGRRRGTEGGDEVKRTWYVLLVWIWDWDTNRFFLVGFPFRLRLWFF